MKAEDAIAGDWFRSIEEDAPDRLVYRPAEYPFPRSRHPRESLQLASDGTARQATGPAPDDRRTDQTGTWELYDNNLVVHLPESDTENRYEVESVDADRLILRPKEFP